MHVRDVSTRSLTPLIHRVRVLLRIPLNRRRRATIRVALAQDRVYGAALHLAVTQLNRRIFIGLWIVRKVRDLVALRLQLSDSHLELRHRGTDVGQLDDVGIRQLSQAAKFGKRVRYLLLVAEILGKLGKNARSHRNVALDDLDAGRRREFANNRQQRTGCE